MPRTTTGIDRATPTQNRRVMSASSGLGPLSAVTITGSRAIPQIGHEPGPGLTDLRVHRARPLDDLIGRRGGPARRVLLLCTCCSYRPPAHTPAAPDDRANAAGRRVNQQRAPRARGATDSGLTLGESAAAAVTQAILDVASSIRNERATALTPKQHHRGRDE